MKFVLEVVCEMMEDACNIRHVIRVTHDELKSLREVVKDLIDTSLSITVASMKEKNGTENVVSSVIESTAKSFAKPELIGKLVLWSVTERDLQRRHPLRQFTMNINTAFCTLSMKGDFEKNEVYVETTAGDMKKFIEKYILPDMLKEKSALKIINAFHALFTMCWAPETLRTQLLALSEEAAKRVMEKLKNEERNNH